MHCAAGCLGVALVVSGAVAASPSPVGAAPSEADAASFSRQWAVRFFAPPGKPSPWESRTARHEGALPFSFIYSGRHSADLVGRWKVEVREKSAGRNRRLRVLTLTDPETGLEVRAEAAVYTDTGGVDWTLHFTNRGSTDTPILEDIQALDMRLTPHGNAMPVLHRLNGSTGSEEDWLPLADPLPINHKIEFGPYGEQANSSSGACPFFNLRWEGGGVVTAVGWSAPWRACVERGEGGGLRLRVGLPQTHLRLRPGESIRSPRILQLYWSGEDDLEGANRFRQVMLAHILPRKGEKAVTPPVAYSSMTETDAQIRAHLEAMRGLGFEVFWQDAWWHKGHYPAGAGNYGFPIERMEDRDRFPSGMSAVGEAVHREGMQFLLWFAPESPWEGSALAVEHPEWVTRWEKDKPLGDWCQLDLGIPEAREYITRYLSDAIRAYRIDWLRMDAGMITAFARDRNDREPERVGMAETRYVEGLYRMWDDLLAAHPGLVIDNCYGGGRRIDLETSARSLPLWRTDVTVGHIEAGRSERTAILNQSMTAGLNRYVPFSLCGTIGVEPYFIRSGFNGGLLCGSNLPLPEANRARLKEALTEVKRLRKYVQGNFYPLLPVTTDARDWCAYQYYLPGKGEGMVLVFRRHESSASQRTLVLRGIDPDAFYEITQSHGYRRPRPARMKGSDLQRLTVSIEEQPGSLLVEYRKAKV
ncbi:MAG: alpha-galactosidase [Armatimonadetes bacterium]|nr:alpha-galactosidase [Armatimonadota bacterium]